jgi:2-oxoglutarate ferredoxin oxidoreductase subunit alpha
MSMNDYSVLIGGRAGFGIDKSGTVIAKVLNQLGRRIYIYRDYPSVIRGGHTFSIIRSSKEIIAAHKNNVDAILALDQDTINLHKDRLVDNSVIICDPEVIKLEGLNLNNQIAGVPIARIIKEENASEIIRNACILGAFIKVSGINWEILESVFREEFTKEADLNLKVARRGYDAVQELVKVEPLPQEKLPLLSGNQAVSLGLIKGGLKAYISYPMTPTSPILHFLAEIADDFGLKVIHPESEIGVMLISLGFSYMGERVAMGTSGGGFCLMTEGLSFAGMAELPVVIIVGQRPGPSTGLPTYSSQTDLSFVLHAGQGEFVRFIVAPGDTEEAYFWSAQAMNISWKYQIPAIVLTDKNLGEGVFNFDISSVPEIKDEKPSIWDRQSPYKRYLNTENGVSPLAFVPDKEAIVKVNSYEHDEYGITIEDYKQTRLMQDKRLRKETYLGKDLEALDTLKVYGKNNSPISLLCWGSNKGVCVEAAERLGLKVIQPIVLSPFPAKKFQEAISGVKKLVCVENSAKGELAKLIIRYGFKIDESILKYDGRPFDLDELEDLIKGVMG